MTKYRMFDSPAASAWLAAAMAAMLAATALASRPLLPVDETRYVTVAWEMHQSGDPWVSHLNGATYSHKPPLLFWLINAVWSLTGVSALGARLVGPTAAVACVLLTSRLAARLWPASPNTAAMAPLIQASLMLWVFFCPLTMFDTLLSLAAVAALLGVVRAAGGRAWSGWLIAGALMGLGVLAKGPVIFVHVLPAAVAGPWWSEAARQRPWRWYGGVVLAAAISAVIGLAWAIPSAIQGGPAYAEELLWGQTAGRLVRSFAHQEPWWWYLMVLPLCLLPWLILRSVWKGARNAGLDSGVKFCLCWFGGTMLILSLVSGKQVYYPLPSLAAVALLAARGLAHAPQWFHFRDIRLLRGVALVAGLAPLFLNHFDIFARARLAEIVPTWACIPLTLCGVVFLWRRLDSALPAVRAIACTVTVYSAILVVCMSHEFWYGFEMQDMGRFVASRQQRQAPVAWMGAYHGQLGFAGRLQEPLTVVQSEDVSQWLRRNPDGCLIVRLIEKRIPAECEYLTRVPGHVPAVDLSELTRLAAAVPMATAWYPATPRVVHATPMRSGLKLHMLLALQFDASPTVTPRLSNDEQPNARR